MKQALQFRLGQSLTMTPQLQQAIRLLQLSTLELNTEIQEALDSNMMLEMSDESDSENNPANETNSVESQNNKKESQDDNNSDSQLENVTDLSDSNTIPEDLPVDTSWDDIYDSVLPGTNSSASSSYNADDQPEVYTASSESLHEHLAWQLKMTPFSETDAAIAEVVIDEINDDGFLNSSVEEITASFEDIEIEVDEVEAVLRQIQNFDPAGVGARDLKESLSIQLHHQPNDTDLREYAITLVEKYFDLLANREYAQLMRKMKLSEEDLKDVIQLIQSMNPRPGSQITANQPEYIIPDVTVKKMNGRWKVELNPDAAPKLRINSTYANMIKNVKNSSDNDYMKNHLQEARWFIKSLLSRNETLLKVSNCIVERQKDFLEYGEEAMRALVLHDIAEAVEMHESTISRVTTKKYMHTPRGIFELKYFFSSHVSTASGGECSATAIRALIKKLIAAETPKKPLSDNKIATILEEQGINVARRTVAKYRESLAIPPSNERKRLA